MRVTTLFAFALGAAAGVAASWQYFKKQYETILEQELEEMREYYSSKEPKKDISEESENEAEFNKMMNEPAGSKPKSVREYAEELQKQGYTDYGKEFKEKVKEIKNPDDGLRPPYVISPSEFGENDYTEVCLTFYADNLLADENDELVEDVEAVIGWESLSHFGDYEDDAIHVRNDRLKSDFEVIRVEERYCDLVKKRPYKVEV